MLEFKLPELGENIVSGTVVKISVALGDVVKKDQTLFELETDKATVEVPSPVGGVIKDILVKEGDEAKVGQVIAKLETSDQISVVSHQNQAKDDGRRVPNENPDTRDQKPAARREPQTTTPAEIDSSPAPKADVAAAPSVRRLAREIGVDLNRVPGSGPGGRISKDDVKAYAKRLLTSPALISPVETAVARPLPDFTKWGSVDRKSMNNIRKKTAEHLSYCWNTIPHVTQFDKADITDLEALRKKLSTPERRLTITPFLMKVIATALKGFPQFNASVDMSGKEIIFKKYVNIGLAVDTENGLLVPVIRNADQKTIMELHEEITMVAEKARAKKLTLDEMAGSCFTITNLGGIGGSFFTPIVNWPDVAILGVSRGGLEPRYTGTQASPRFMLPLSLSYDHRVIDGADGARFLRWVCDAIQQPFPLDMK